jgi:hypothetical protein
MDISPLSASIGKKGHALGLEEPAEVKPDQNFHGGAVVIVLTTH